MDSFKSFTDRIIQPSPTILGLKLLPFTLGMSILLKAGGSKFLLGGFNKSNEQQLIGELVFALLVCSTTYDSFKEEIHNGSFQVYVNDYVRKLNEEIKQSKEFCLVLKINQFINYLRNGTTAPLYHIKHSDNEEVSSNPIEPEEAIISTLMCECGYNRNECLNLPLNETLSAYLLYAHKQGTLELISKDVYELMQKMKGIK